MGTEIELKLLIDRASLAKLRRHPLVKSLCGSKPVRQKLHSVYFDTPEQDLRRNGVALRLRRAGSRWTQTVKGGGRVQAGLHQREEVEARVAANVPDFDKIVDPGLLRLFTRELRHRLRPAFVTDFWRTAWLLEFPQGERVELALDLGEIRAGDGRAAIGELELELKAGSTARLFEFALELQQDIPLRIENRSKADRGYGLLNPAGPPVLRAAPPRLSRRMGANEALREILWECLTHLQDNANGVLYGADPESLHQMRVAVRRLLSALRLAGSVAAEAPPAEISEGLRWLMSEFGPARDWDVFLGETLLPVLAHFSDHSGLAALRREVLGLRDASRQTAREAVGSQRYTRLVLAFGGWLAAERWGRSPGAPGAGPVTGLARDLLRTRHRQIVKRGKGLAGLDAGERHRLRIAAKKMRYSLEFFAGLYPRKAVDPYLKALTALQDRLGLLNDAAVTRSLLDGIELPRRDLAAAEARGIVAGWVECRAAQELRKMGKAWGNFKQSRAFW